MTRIKPFAYDVLETPTSLLFVFPYHGADGHPAMTTLGANGLQLDRPDGTIIRLGNLHPRVREVVARKSIFACELNTKIAVLYGTNGNMGLNCSLAEHIGEAFYWYIGPETSTIREVADRPLSLLLTSLLDGPAVVAPGDHLSGPPIGLCLAPRRIATLANGRKWAQARPGLIVDAGFAAGTATGYPITDDIIASVNAAHDDPNPPKSQGRRAWKSQIACAFRASTDETPIAV